jgi:small subunit ribosomal protein S6
VQSPPLGYSQPLPVAAKPAYDLFVLIDADAPEERRSGILDGIKQQIASGGGELKSDVDWGMRKLAFEISHRGDAYYHLYQLEADPELLKTLEHSLSIDDAVLRYRIIRLSKGVPDKPPPSPAPSAPRATQPADDQAPAPAAVSETPEAAAAPEAPEASEPVATEPPEAPESSEPAPQE